MDCLRGADSLHFSRWTGYAPSKSGSKWATIAIRIPSKDQASIKNKFYSTLRKGFRKINSYITDIKRRSDPVRLRAFKTIQDIFISKLIAVVDGSHEEKYEVKPAALALAAGISEITKASRKCCLKLPVLKMSISKAKNMHMIWRKDYCKRYWSLIRTAKREKVNAFQTISGKSLKNSKNKNNLKILQKAS